MEVSQMSVRDLALYAFVFNVIAGFVLGLIPLVIGLKRGRKRYALLGFAASLIGGALLGIILSIPATLIFTWLVLRRQPGETAGEGGDER